MNGVLVDVLLITIDGTLNPLQPKRTRRSSLENALFYKILRFVQGTRGFGHVQLMNNTLLEVL